MKSKNNTSETLIHKLIVVEYISCEIHYTIELVPLYVYHTPDWLKMIKLTSIANQSEIKEYLEKSVTWEVYKNNMKVLLRSINKYLTKTVKGPFTIINVDIIDIYEYNNINTYTKPFVTKIE